MTETTTASHKYYYPYDPSKVAAVIFVVLFLLASLFHIFQVIRKRTWYFVALIIGALMECIGYLARFQNARQNPDYTLGPFIVQTLLILVAPSLVAATVYMILGRIILTTDGERYSFIKKRWLTKIFVVSDVVSFFILAIGGSMLTGDHPKIKLGQNLILVGLFSQITAFGIFILVAILFHKRLHAHPTSTSMTMERLWKKHMYALYFVSFLILIRSIIRVVEYLQGTGGYIMSHEAFLYIFDATLMLIAVVTFNVVHPSEIIPGKGVSSNEMS